MYSTIQKALKESGQLILQNFGKINSYTQKESQSSIVTQTDMDSEKLIMEIIAEAYPDHNLLGEETGFQDKGSEYTWVVDPIDGTSNFAAGIPWFGVIICVLKNFKPEMAGCYLPAEDKLYFAEKGKGASLNGVPIAVSNETSLKDVLMAYSLDYSDVPGKTEREAGIIQNLVQNVRNMRSTNCIIDFCYTADGKLGGCANQTTRIWDIAGPVLLIEEAGGIATDLSGNSFDFTVDENNFDRNFEIVASSKSLHPLLMKLV